jgi:probable HAF family extracellular repeat protein
MQTGKIAAVFLLLACGPSTQVEPNGRVSATIRLSAMTDLGTLGGGEWSQARGVNNSGLVVGQSQVAGGAFHAFAWSKAEGMVDLGTFGGAYSWANSVNDRGWIVGASDTAAGNVHAFVWTTNGGMVDLDPLGGIYSEAVAVSETGYVVGARSLDGDGNHAFVWTETDGMIDLGTLGDYYSSRAVAVSNAGHVVGLGLSNSGGDYRAFVWTKGTGIVDLGTAGGEWAEAIAVSDSGQVVIRSSNLDDGRSQAVFLWSEAGGLRDLCPAPCVSYADAVSDSGHFIAGVAVVGDGTRSVVWTNTGGTLEVLGSEFVPFEPRAVNNAGRVVGDAYTTAGGHRALAWRRGAELADLGTLGGDESEIRALSDSGYAVGFSDTVPGVAGKPHAFIWKGPSP